MRAMAAKKKKSKKRIIIIILCIIALLVIGWWAFCIYVYNDSFDISAESYASRILTGWNAQNILSLLTGVRCLPAISTAQEKTSTES